MLINQKDFLIETTEDTVKLSQGIRKKSDGNYTMIHVDRDAWMIELVNNTSEEGYISFKRAPATVGEPSFTTLFHFDKDGNQYFGDPDTNGTVRLKNNAGVVEVTVRVAGVYTYIGGFGSAVWDDVRTPAITGKLGVGNPPTFAQFKDDGSSSVGVYTYSFADEAVSGNEEQLYFAVQLPHTYKEGTDIKAHVHWAPAVSGGANEFVKWGLEYTWADMDGTFGNTTIITSDASSAITATKSGDVTLVADKHYFTDIGTISGTGKDMSSMLICRLFRNSSDGDDDLAQAAFLFEMDFHFQIDLVGGSREEFVK